MFRFLGSKRRNSHDAASKEDGMKAIEEASELERALGTMDLVMDGQIDKANEVLANMDSMYGYIARGVLHFIEATTSFEQDAIQRAIHTLSFASDVAGQYLNESQRSGLKFSKFRAGAECELVQIETGLMCAVAMLVTESKIDTIKALYKLRKTYLALEELRKHMEAQKDAKQPVPEIFDDLPDKLKNYRTLRKNRFKSYDKTLELDVYPETTFDEYLVSGVKACDGLIQLIISMVPPNFAKVILNVLGFKGNREVALQMLWTALQDFTNIHSSLALLALLQFFDGPLQYRDLTLPREEEDEISKKYETAADLDTKTTNVMTPADLRATKVKLTKALQRTRKYYPHGVLWLLQDGRMVAKDDLVKGVEILESKECGPNQMRQVEGLLVFDRTNMLLSLHRLKESTDSFVELMDLSTWSHALYLYMAGACQLEIYRNSPETAEGMESKERAGEFLYEARRAIGKKKFLARTMPFDQFVVRKVETIEKRAKALNLHIADAVGTSLLYEAMYFWGGHSRMPQDLVAKSIKALDYSRHGKFEEPESEIFTRKLMTAIYMRYNQQAEEGAELLDEILPSVVTISPGTIQYHLQKEPWAGPVAIYEKAIYEWAIKGSSAHKKVRYWLKVAEDWEGDYELSTRINMRITAAKDRLDIYRM